MVELHRKEQARETRALRIAAAAMGITCALGLAACASTRASRSTRPQRAESVHEVAPSAGGADEPGRDGRTAPSAPEDATAEASSAAPSAQVDPSVAERDAYDRARPAFERHCARCHASDGDKAKRGSLKHFNMDGYPFGGHHASEIGQTVREVLGGTGLQPSMPRDNPGAVTGEDLAVMLAWADAFERAYPRSAHSEHGHQHKP